MMTLGRDRARANEGTMDAHRRRRDARVRDRDETAKETRGLSSVKHDGSGCEFDESTRDGMTSRLDAR